MGDFYAGNEHFGCQIDHIEQQVIQLFNRAAQIHAFALKSGRQERDRAKDVTEKKIAGRWLCGVNCPAERKGAAPARFVLRRCSWSLQRKSNGRNIILWTAYLLHCFRHQLH